ncbi:MAG: mannonate dehydratase [Lachnospiraceae bacterium]|nr:mannonate dehydratase [Lachnospiraceae bacterium]
MKMTFRWYGSKTDPIPLRYVKQIPGMTGIMGLLDKPAGEGWPEEEFSALKKEVNDAGLEIEVIESVNVHEDIKLGLSSREEYIDNYIKTIRMLSRNGVKVVVYNFMPVFDWLRTDLARVIPEDGSNSLYFDEKDLGEMGPLEIVRRTAEGSHGFTLPGWEPERLALLETTLKQYENIGPDDLRKNYKYFLDAVIPVCEETGIRMACHPDDPAWPIFGLPRIAHSFSDLKKITELCDSPANALCLCTGSLGSNPENDIPSIIRYFGEKDRIGAMHVRNVKHLGYRNFREAAHLSTAGDLDMYEIVKAIYETCPDTYIRPDHGRMIWDEQGRPGYGLYDRALGAAYINGLWEAVDKAHRQ